MLLRGAASRIVANMEASLSVPTATSVRSVPARLLEVNRLILNNQLARTTGAKVSFTHIIGYAVVRALHDVPSLNSAFVADADGSGKPGVIHHKHVGLGLAVDQEKSDGTRTLLVPCIKEADTLDFRSFVLAYEELIRKIHTNKIAPDDFSGTTVSLTNPGTLGTVQSVPRLMPGQGAIIGVGALGYPPGFEAADPRVLAELGLGKVVTLTSTYDHRIIQGAESGLFLGRVASLLTGADGFYDDLFESMGVPYEPVRWQVDNNAGDGTDEGEHQRLVKQVHVQTLINMYRVRGHLIAHLDPLDAEPPHIHPELDPLTYGLTIWDLPRQFVADGLAGRDVATLDEILHVLRDAYCRTLAIEYMHIQDPEQKRWIQEHVEGQPTTLKIEEQRHILDRLNAAEVFERFLHTRYVGQKRFGLEGAESTIVLLDALLDAAAGSGVAEVVMGMAHRGRLNVLANIVGKSYREIFEEFEGNLDPDSVQGSGDVKYHKGARGIFHASAGEELPITLASNPSHLEAVDPVVEGMTRAKQDRLSPPTDGTPAAAGRRRRRIPLHVRARSRRRRVRRAGRRRRDTQPLGAVGLSHRRHGARRHQQPARLHDGAGLRAHVGVPDRRGQDGPGPDLPRQRRRPRGGSAGGPPRLRLPADLPQGRRDRPRVLPQARPQRGRRPELHATADVPADRGQAVGPQALHRDAGAPGRHHARGGRVRTRRLQRPAAGRPRRGTRGALAGADRAAHAGLRPRRHPVTARPASTPRCCTRCPRSCARCLTAS